MPHKMKPHIARHSSTYLDIGPRNLPWSILVRQIIKFICYFFCLVKCNGSHIWCEEAQLHINVPLVMTEHHLEGHKTTRSVGNSYIVSYLDDGPLYVLLLDWWVPRWEIEDVKVDIVEYWDAERKRRPSIGNLYGAIDGSGKFWR